MSHEKKTDSEIRDHKSQVLCLLEKYMDDLILSSKSVDKSKADKLSYWIKDWITFLEFEDSFSPKSLRRYKRGEIIKVHLGFNVGSEEGGLHYAIVIDKNNAKSSPVLSIIPLTSVKSTTDINNLKNGSIFLGNELYTSLNAKISSTYTHLVSEIEILEKAKEESKIDPSDKQFQEKIKLLKKELELLKRMQKEISKMKNGSIALVNQITTISKIRIYDPKTDYDILSNIRLSNEKLDLIDNQIRQMFTNIKE